MKKIFLSIALMATALLAEAQVNINIDALQRGPEISPTHYGIFYEDINHAADGGIYAELIRNRSFEDGPRFGAPADMQAWSMYAAAPSQLTATLIQPSKNVKLLNDAQHNALELNVNASAASPVCLINVGFWGINAVQGRQYRMSFWAKGKYKGNIKATLCDEHGTNVYAIADVEAVLTKDWTKYEAVLQSEGNDEKALFALVFDGVGVIDLDVVSLFPPTFKNRENGMRPDLANMLWQMHPKFMRFPGGCFVEGQESPENAFRWERTIGPIEEREGHWNVNWGYRTTDGLGFHEYLQLAEDLGAKPLYVVNVGIWHGGYTPLDSLKDTWLKECLDALEYANGDVNTKYGALRAENGHPEPFNIEYLEIGNENYNFYMDSNRDQSHQYPERYKLFYDAIKAKYPNIKIIGNVESWGTDKPSWRNSYPVDLLDEHYYRTPAWFADNFRKYDTYPRTLPNGNPAPKIYVGEYAVTNGFGNLGNQNAALGEAVYMMGMENNSDIVPMNSYAPIFVNENDAKWRPDMIRFSSSRVMGTPSYYVQMLMAQNVGKQVVKVEQDNPYEGQMRKRITPKQSRVGYSSWGTQASYTHCDPLPKTGKPEFVSGHWEMNDDILQQKGREEAPLAICNHVIDSDHYTIQCRARKDGGPEGFIIVFNYVDPQNYCWLNIGGWGNTQHAIEQISSGGKLQTVTKRGQVEEGRWYDVKLQVSGDSVKAWLDTDLVFDTVLKSDQSKGIFSSATIDDEAGEMIVKIVNSGDEGTTANINLKNFEPKSARVIRLKANDGIDENTLQSPTHISPVEQQLSPDRSCVQLEVPAYSLNIVRIKLRR